MASTSAATPLKNKRKFENGKKKPKTLKDEFGEKLDIKPVIVPPKPADEYDYDSSDEEVGLFFIF